jgi:hypothetical protein
MSQVELDRNERVLLERICAAYNRALQDEAAGGTYAATMWWKGVEAKHLHAVREALQSSDIERLHSMYSGFYRERCGHGLVRHPPGHGSDRTTNLDRESYSLMREDMLYRIGYWRRETGDKYPISALSGPEVGCPFGIRLDGVFVAAGSEYQHACADRVQSVLVTGSTVAELGGGFGHMAYFLLGMDRSLTYIGFDVPESLALCAYYLGQARPDKRLLLYGETYSWRDCISAADVLLMPASEMIYLPDASVDVTFSSHLLADLQPVCLETYAREMARFTNGYVISVTIESSPEQRYTILRAMSARMRLLKTRSLDWNLYRAPGAREWEDLYAAVHG